LSQRPRTLDPEETQVHLIWSPQSCRSRASRTDQSRLHCTRRLIFWSRGALRCKSAESVCSFRFDAVGAGIACAVDRAHLASLPRCGC
jgi:hypothetical protein